MKVATSQWERVKELFQAALDLDPSQRVSFLAENCHDDDLRQQVQKLLIEYQEAGNFLDDPVLNAGAAGGTPSPSATLTSTYDPRAGRVYLRLARESSSSHSVEIRDLLLRRLKVIVLVGLSTNAFMNAVRFARLRPLFSADNLWHVWLPAAFNLLVLTGLTAVLYRKRIYNLVQLRWIEAIAFGTGSLYFLFDTYFTNFERSGGYLLQYVDRHPAEMILVSRTTTILWVMLIIAYGTFIPNTGRRCAAVVIAMASSPMVLVSIAGVFHPEIPRRLLILFLVDMAMWLGCAVAMSIFGSHKITVLRQEAMAARKLGQYNLKRLLGRGGMGEVYLAEHMLLKRPCAVKVIRPDQTSNRSSLERFLREVQVTATLTHPNTVQIFDYGQTDDGTVFYAMEYLAGLNLEKLVHEYGPLPATRIVWVLAQLCGALAEAHAAGLIHRDIKPSNVILCRRGGLYDVAKLLDFGLVRMQSTNVTEAGFTQSGLIFGTPAYMSPEQAAANKELDARSDIYSLGALAWFLSTGEPPFVRDSIVQTMIAHMNEDVPALRSVRHDLPEDLAAIVQRCLAKDPNRRFSAITSLEQALTSCSSAGAWSQSEAATWWNAVSDVAEVAKDESTPHNH
jgi:serine/threonine-protein kinase